MSFTLYLRLLRMSRSSTLAWAIIMDLWALLIVLIYPSIAGMGQEIMSFAESMPEGMRAAMGLGTPEEIALTMAGGVFTLPGYLNIEYLAWLPLVLGIYAVIYCGGLISKEAERGTLDTLLSQPLRRNSFLLTKFLAFSSQTTLILFTSFLTIVLGAFVTEETIDASNLMLVHFSALLVILSIAGYSTLASSIFLDSGRALTLAGLITALSYFLNILGGAIPEIGWLKSFSLFHYYDSLEIVAKGTISGSGVLLYLTILFGSIGSSLWIFHRKNLTG